MYQRSNLTHTARKPTFKPSKELSERLHYTMTNRHLKSRKMENEKINTIIAVVSAGLLLLMVIGIKIGQYIGENI